MPRRVSDRLIVWGSEVEDSTVEQALKAARLPIVSGHVALMPDAHIGKGATIGSVIPTESAVIPSAVGVDIGCGMVAVRTDIRVDQLPDDLRSILRSIERAIPAGVGTRHTKASDEAQRWFLEHQPARDLTDVQIDKTLEQFGTLGSGNHFFEVSVDENDDVWLVLHSGSRGIGNELATIHIGRAKALMRDALTSLGDPDLAYFVQGTKEFDEYIRDMLWAQEYAMANRAQMMDAAVRVLFRQLGIGRELQRINCHHNFAQHEEHDGRAVWVTRKGAIKADVGDMGIIPGSMGSPTFIVRGKGNPLAYKSCAHGAGRRLSRTKARKAIDVAQMRALMGTRVWNTDRAHKLLDEAPHAYKDILQVMRDQEDLVEVVHELRQIVNYKGT